MYPEGGGLEFAGGCGARSRPKACRFSTASSSPGCSAAARGRIAGAVGIHSRTGEFHAIKARATIVATNAITFRSGFVRDITGTGTLLAYRAGASLRNAEFSYVRPGTPKFYFEGITFAIQEGAHFVNAKGEAFMRDYEPDWGDEADVPRIARAMAMENEKGNAPLYLDMSAIPEELRDYFIQSKVKWMDCFFRKLGNEAQHRHVRQDALLRAQPDDQDGDPHRARLPLRRAGPAGGRASRRPAAPTISPDSISACASAMAGSPGAARSRISTALPPPRLDAGRGAGAARRDACSRSSAGREPKSDRILRELQADDVRL